MKKIQNLFDIMEIVTDIKTEAKNKNILKVTILLFTVLFSINTAMAQTQKISISKALINKTIDSLAANNKPELLQKITKCVTQTANIWEGKPLEFQQFVFNNFISDENDLEKLFDRFSHNFEVINGAFNDISLELKRPSHLNSPNYEHLGVIDNIFSSYEPSSHFNSDFYSNNLAYIITLNFPSYSLDQKTKLSQNWTQRDWAKARLGDYFTTKVPAEINQAITKAQNDADNYIANYYIYMGNIVDKDFNTYFPKNMKLISHWNLRDELKSNYSKDNGIVNQKLIYNIMTKIISQEIPNSVINSNSNFWNPITNQLFDQNNKLIKDTNLTKPENNIRYQHILNNFNAIKNSDKYYPNYKNYFQRKFDSEYEITQANIEKLFIQFLTTPEIKNVAKLIKSRLNRDLEPFDIWYDGFKSRSNINEEDLNKLTKAKYPNAEAVQDDLFLILTKLGFTKAKAEFLVTKIDVEPSKGAGHAWGAQSKNQKSYLRTRIGEDGMDYKGYNIGIHEFGHNVEQTFSLYDIEEYLIAGVPNNAFTEAIAFLFQMKDLQLLGLESNDETKKYLYTLDNFWATYEIMGVALVDQYIWKWLYSNPNATPKELNVAVNNIAKEVWNKYYAEIFGIKDQTILAIYSHSIDYPLYLSAYPLGHIIEFQLDNHIEELINSNSNKNSKNNPDKNAIFAKEVERFCKIGKILPNSWMNKAVGSDISIKPMTDATNQALNYIK